jgi:outer membrane lipoprotein-sorting protein
MDDNIRKLSEYIDKLNAEQRPDQHGAPEDSPELERLYHAARLVKSLKDPALPGSDYPERLAVAVRNKRRQKPRKRFWQRGMAAAAAVLVIAVMISTMLPFGKVDIVYAMEQAFREVEAYHGVLEIVSTSAEGSRSLRSKLEVWADKEGHYYIRGLEGWQEGIITANNGKEKWQVRPESKEVYVFPAFPDPYSFILELGSEIEQAKDALSTRVVGEETIAGRETDVLEVTPKGGALYRIWVDKETKLPLQKQTAMQNALQSTVTYTSIDFSQKIPGELLVLNVPEGYSEIDKNAEQFVNDLEEAAGAVGFIPAVPGEVPEDFDIDGIAIVPGSGLVKMYYTAQDKETRVVTIQGKAAGEFERASNAILAKVNGSPAEVQSPVQDGRGILEGGQYDGMAGIRSVRWRQDGYEYALVGNASLDMLEQFVTALAGGPVEMPETGEGLTGKPQVEVPVNMEVEQNEQKSVDAGHSPWRLDPAYVAQVFVSLEMSPGGITGDYPIEYEKLEVVENNGVKAVVKVGGDKTPIRKVYLERLIRQDSTGIWTVVGYDPAE